MLSILAVWHQAMGTWNVGVVAMTPRIFVMLQQQAYTLSRLLVDVVHAPLQVAPPLLIVGDVEGMIKDSALCVYNIRFVGSYDTALNTCVSPCSLVLRLALTQPGRCRRVPQPGHQ